MARFTRHRACGSGNPPVNLTQVAPPSVDLCTPSRTNDPPAYMVVGLLLVSTTISVAVFARTCVQLAPLLMEPRRDDGVTLFPFRRLFIVARR